MIQTCVAALALLTLIGMSLAANRRFAPEHTLPMQWSWSGAVNWSASRSMALAFTPLLAALILGMTTVMTVVLPPRPGQEGFATPIITIMSLGFLAAHATHLWLIDRTLSRRGN